MFNTHLYINSNINNIKSTYGPIQQPELLFFLVVTLIMQYNHKGLQSCLLGVPSFITHYQSDSWQEQEAKCQICTVHLSEKYFPFKRQIGWLRSEGIPPPSPDGWADSLETNPDTACQRIGKTPCSTFPPLFRLYPMGFIRRIFPDKDWISDL